MGKSPGNGGFWGYRYGYSKESGSGIMVKQTEASRNGLKYRSASGNAIVNEGEKNLRGYTEEG